MKKFTIDGMISAYGVDLGDHWNGWRTPNFPRDQWQSLIDQMNQWDDGGLTVKEYDGRLISSCIDHESCSLDCEMREYWEIDENGFCALGAYSWIWSVDERLTLEDLTPDNLELLKYIYKELEGWWFTGSLEDYFDWVVTDYAEIQSAEDLNEYMSAHEELWRSVDA